MKAILTLFLSLVPLGVHAGTPPPFDPCDCTATATCNVDTLCTGQAASNVDYNGSFDGTCRQDPCELATGCYNIAKITVTPAAGFYVSKNAQGNCITASAQFNAPEVKCGITITTSHSVYNAQCTAVCTYNVSFGCNYCPD